MTPGLAASVLLAGAGQATGPALFVELLEERCFPAAEEDRAFDTQDLSPLDTDTAKLKFEDGFLQLTWPDDGPVEAFHTADPRIAIARPADVPEDGCTVAYHADSRFPGQGAYDAGLYPAYERWLDRRAEGWEPAENCDAKLHFAARVRTGDAPLSIVAWGDDRPDLGRQHLAVTVFRGIHGLAAACLEDPE